MEFQRKNSQPVLKLKEKEGVPFLYFPLLEETGCVKQGFSTRLGGVSEGVFSSMNLSFTRNDKEDAVRTNFMKMARALEVDETKFVFTDQTHTTNVRRVYAKDAGKGFISPKDYQDVDGLITDVRGLVLSTFFADCVPLYFVDPVQEVIGLSHSGWRGTVGKIGKITVEAMTREFGTNPKDVRCGIGPSICQACYEVSEDVAQEFGKQFTVEQCALILEAKEEEKYQLDLWKANQLVLIEAGVLAQNIETTDLCTCCNSTLFFSHRASQGKRGNLGAFLSLRERDGIVSYVDLTKIEQEEACIFFHNLDHAKTVDELRKEWEGKIYDFGKGVLLFYEKGQIRGKLNVVLEAAKILRAVYLHSIVLFDTSLKGSEVLKMLIGKARELADDYGAVEHYLGIRGEEVLECATNLGLKTDYHAFQMELMNHTIQEPLLELRAVTIENIETYRDIYNRSFMDMPHGTILEEFEEEAYVHHFFVCKDGNCIGFLSLDIKDTGEEGFFDIGLCKEYRGLGYGKRLLETAISCCKERHVKRICLTVIEKNMRAYNMYKKRGFEVYKVLSHWIDLTKIKREPKIN